MFPKIDGDHWRALKKEQSLIGFLYLQKKKVAKKVKIVVRVLNWLWLWKAEIVRQLSKCCSSSIKKTDMIFGLTKSILNGSVVYLNLPIFHWIDLFTMYSQCQKEIYIYIDSISNWACLFSIKIIIIIIIKSTERVIECTHIAHWWVWFTFAHFCTYSITSWLSTCSLPCYFLFLFFRSVSVSLMLSRLSLWFIHIRI